MRMSLGEKIRRKRESRQTGSSHPWCWILRIYRLFPLFSLLHDNIQIWFYEGLSAHPHPDVPMTNFKCRGAKASIRSSRLNAAYSWSTWKQFWIPTTPEKESPQLPSGTHSRVYQPPVWGNMFNVSSLNPSDYTVRPCPRIPGSWSWKTAGFYPLQNKALYA